MFFVYKLCYFIYICKQKTNEQIYYSYTTSRSKKNVWI